jgi:8-oxo-dGTP pyrophosphatase MutT (NUDIX family)
MANGAGEPGQLRNTGPETTPRLAATVILMRGGTGSLEVLLVKRNPESRFMGGAWVFPGGAVQSDDGDGQDGLRATAIRELAEEAGIALSGPDLLVPFSRWITPAEVAIRFDTWFFLASAPADATPEVDGAEIVDARWYTAQQALDAGTAGEILLVFPTIKHLQQLSAFESVRSLLDHARVRQILPVQPRVITQGETARIVLPGEPGYDG